MSSAGSIHEDMDFLYSVATGTEAEFKDLVLRGTEKQVTLLVECLANVLYFIPEITHCERIRAENIVHAYVVDNERQTLLKKWDFIRSIIARILLLVYKTEIWRVLLHHG